MNVACFGVRNVVWSGVSSTNVTKATPQGIVLAAAVEAEIVVCSSSQIIKVNDGKLSVYNKCTTVSVFVFFFPTEIVKL